MKLSKIGQQIEQKGIKIIFAAKEEHLSIKEQFCECCTESEINELINRLEYDISAWFCASVMLEINSLCSRTVYLGGCSYSSLDEFTSTDNDYFDQMLNEAYTDLQGKLSILQKTTLKNL